jgi:hypothetical protein
MNLILVIAAAQDKSKSKSVDTYRIDGRFCPIMFILLRKKNKPTKDILYRKSL